jgi:hypothetical protein
MIVLQIAAGIVLAVLFLAFLPWILAAASFGIVLLMAAVVIGLLAAFVSQMSAQDWQTAGVVACWLVPILGVVVFFNYFPRALAITVMLLCLFIGTFVFVLAVIAALEREWGGCVVAMFVFGLFVAGYAAIVRAERRRKASIESPVQ